jgi:AcrR family transcriptional regulator
MRINPDDPRVRKTRRSLQQALVRLILRDGYDTISVQDIAEEAETARVTFYRHYTDKQDLLTDCLNTLYDDLANRTARLTADQLLAGQSPISVLYTHIEAEEPLYRVLFSSRGTRTVISRMHHHLAQHAIAAIDRSGATPVANIPKEIMGQHIASSQIGLAMWWLEHNKPYPADYMAKLSMWLTLSGLIDALGGSPIKPPPPTFPSRIDHP